MAEIIPAKFLFIKEQTPLVGAFVIPHKVKGGKPLYGSAIIPNHFAIDDDSNYCGQFESYWLPMPDKPIRISMRSYSLH